MDRLVRSARFWSCCSLSLVILRVKSAGMDVNKDFYVEGSLVTENCLICCAKTELFGTVKVFLLRGERTETRCLDTAYVGLHILLVMGRKGLPRFVNFRKTVK